MNIEIKKMTNHMKLCAVVLAGGQGSRMNGVDKGLQLFRGQSLFSLAVQRLQAQTLTPDSLCINANRNLQDYRCTCRP